MKMMQDRLNSANILEAVLEVLKGRYKYLKPLKPGGFSKVYLVQHRFLGECVLKIMDYGYIMDTLERKTSEDSMGEFEEIKKRFINEARLYKKINHPNIVQIYDIDIIEIEEGNKKIEIPYLIMNYIKGKSLRELIKHKEMLDFQTALKLSENILSALEALHRQKVIHRDIKPDNIMIEEKGGQSVLIDFGLAKDKLKENTLTTFGFTMGTPAYMPPEQFENLKNLDLRADIYSFGVVLYEMLSGEVPFKGRDKNPIAEIMYAHSHIPIPDVREKNTGLPPGIEHVIFKAMAKNPGDRYQSTKEFLNALKAVKETPGEIEITKKTDNAPIKREPGEDYSNEKYPTEKTPIEESNVHHKRPETRKSLVNLLIIIAALLAILIGGFIVINPLKGPDKEQLDQYRENADPVHEFTKNGENEKSNDYPGKAKQFKDSEEIKKDFEEFKESLKEKASPGSKIAAVDRYKDKLERFPETDETKLIAFELSKIRAQLEKENPFGDNINKKAKRIYKNGRGFWEADYGDGIVMVYIPPGDFTMGSNDYTDEKPSHTVYLAGYWMGKNEVTFAQYDKYCEETQKKKTKPDDRGWGRVNRPVIYVSWHDASAYCDWLSNKTGLRFKLPTEAQWEKAARGTDSRKYPWGDHDPYYNGEYYANYDPGKDGADVFRYTAPVGSYPRGASPYGLFDMAGNVCEWCSDWHDKNYYKNSPQKNPAGPESGSFRVLRGGSWVNNAGYIRCAYRSFASPSFRVDLAGFRLCQENR